MNIYHTVCAAALAAFSSACLSAAPNADKGGRKEPAVVWQIAVTDFTSISHDSEADIFYTQSDRGPSVEIEAPERLQDALQVTVKEGRLVVSDHRHTSHKSVKVVVRVSSKELNAISLTGVGDIKVRSKLETDKFAVRHKGVGDVELTRLNCTSLDVDAAGVGDVELGRVDAATCRVRHTGVGDVECKAIDATTLTIENKAVGDVEFKNVAVQDLTAENSGVGDISLEGRADTAKLANKQAGDIEAKKLLARVVDASLTGSGDIDCYAAETLTQHSRGEGKITRGIGSFAVTKPTQHSRATGRISNHAGRTE